MSTDRRSLLEDSLAAIDRLQARLDAVEAARHEPIAIVGTGCRYPGGVETPDQFWALLRDGVDAVADVPADRWDADAYYDADPAAPGKMITRRGGFLRQVDRFDAGCFGISPREAQTLDPQQRLLLETSLEALESAAIAPETLVGSATGVFIGITTSDYGTLVRAGGVEQADVYSATGNALNAAAGRIAFTFGFQGPTVAVDTACSSSLVAVHLACRALRNGEADLALAGGVNVVLSPDAMIMFSKWGMLAPDGRCKTFDAAADGFVRAEGCAMLALKRLSTAMADGDPILAVIRGSAVNQDGRSSGLTVPNGPAQQNVLRRALADAALAPADIDYVEAHGTGTPLGDPIELEALGAVMSAGRPTDRPLLVGSVKTNLGHTEAASGVAGLLKVALALRHERIPAHLHFHTPTPAVPWDRLSLAVPTALTPWPRGARVRRAGVSAFGFSGTNAHVILEEAPVVAGRSPAAAADLPVLLPLSARGDGGLRAVAGRMADFLAGAADPSLADVAWTAGVGRAHLSHRLAIVADHPREVERQLRSFAAGEAVPELVHGTMRAGERPKIAFVFTGQGAQYPGMGQTLYHREQVFRDAIDRAAAILAPLLDRPLLAVLFPADGASTPLGETAYTQPALFALEYALTELWRSWGITPSVVLGHSVGEYVAACVAGVMSLEDGLALIAERGRLMQALPAGGGMAAIFADESCVLLRLGPYRGRLAVAAVNGPEETVISGDATALAEVLAGLGADGIQSRALDVSHAFHSHRLDPMLDALERRAGTMAFAAPRIALLSNVSGAAFPAGARPDAAYWRRHAREPVRFAANLDALRAAGVTAVVEVGPHPTLLALAARSMPNPPWISTASLRRGRDDWRTMLSALGALYARGAAVSWRAVAADTGSRRLSMPTYPFQRERHWIEATAKPVRPSALDGHPLLGERRELAGSPGTHIWETEISLEHHPWLRDHRVQGAAIVPATAYIEMALAAGYELFGNGSLVAEQIENLKPLILQEGAHRRLQTTLVVEAGQAARFSVHSREGTSPFVAHVTARLSATATPSDATAADGRALVDAARARCATAIDGQAFYTALARKGNQWGPSFQGMQEVWLGDGEAVGRVQVPASLIGESSRYRFHPAVSDSCGHSLVATVPFDPRHDGSIGAFVGGGVGQVRFHQPPSGTTLWTHARLHAATDARERVVIGDVRVYDDSGTLVSETLDARLWYLDDKTSGALLGAPDDWFYETCWHRRALGVASERAVRAGTWIVFADPGGLGEQVAARRSDSRARTVIVSPAASFTLDGDRATVRPGEPADIRRLLDALDAPTAVIHLWSMGAPDDQALLHGPESVLHLLHEIVAADRRPRPRLWLVTGDSQAVVAGDRAESPSAAMLWGMGRTLSVEHAGLWGGLVDVSGAEPADATATQLVHEVESADAEDLVAFRNGQRHLARLERAHPVSIGDMPADADGTYLVTGGLGGLGLTMARWLVERGARHLLLLGRTPLPPREDWPQLDSGSALGRRCAAVVAMESMGARVETASVDVAAEGILERCLEARRVRGEPAVRGVIHAAGILSFRALDSSDVDSLRATLAAKVDGAWRLHRLFADQPLDCFVLCSSSSTLLRSPLLGAYAAGNAFLDALAHHRRAIGLAALSVNWGTWGEVGMAVESGNSKGSMLGGMSTIPTARGLSALGRLLAAGTTQAAVMPIDWADLVRSYPAFAADPFLATLVGEVGPMASRQPAGSGAAAVRDAVGLEQATLLTSYLRSEAARTLGMSPDGLDPALPLSSLGFDSLMAVQLKNQIENDLGVVVPMIQFLDGPSVEHLTPAVQSALAAAPSSRESEVPPDHDAWEAGSI